MTLHREIRFEDEICADLAAAGWLHVEGDAATYDRARALFPGDVLAYGCRLPSPRAIAGKSLTALNLAWAVG